MMFCDEIFDENWKIQQFMWQNIYTGDYLRTITVNSNSLFSVQGSKCSSVPHGQPHP